MRRRTQTHTERNTDRQTDRQTLAGRACDTVYKIEQDDDGDCAQVDDNAAGWPLSQQPTPVSIRRATAVLNAAMLRSPLPQAVFRTCGQFHGRLTVKFFENSAKVFRGQDKGGQSVEVIPFPPKNFSAP